MANSSPTILYVTNSPNRKQGILLNTYANTPGRSPRPFHNGSLPLPSVSDSKSGRISAANSPNIRNATTPLPRTDSGSSTNSTSNLADHSQGHSRANSIRKIRFAPLPDIRALEEAELAQLESPLATGITEDASAPVTPGSAVSHTSSATGWISSGLGLYKTPTLEDRDAYTDTGSEAGGSMRTVSTTTKAKTKSWSKKFLKPLLKSTNNKDGGSISDDGLWRPTSRDSFQSNTSNEGGNSLGRRMTFEGRTRHSSISSNSGGVPLTRVQSAGNPRRQRMLNGRVYGVKPNAFANIRDDTPEFVEWGHGGAGSVNNRAGSSAYASVQTGGKLSIGAVASPSSSTGGGDEDDGSGMAWVRRRKEQRERERREAEEKERQKAQTESTTTTSSAGSEENVKEALEMTMPPPPPAVSSPPTIAKIDTASVAGSPPVETTTTGEEHHHVTTINLPAPPHAHAHAHVHAQGHVTEKPAQPSETSAKSSESDEEGSESESEGDDEDEESEDESEEERRKTALGAGMEKVSRHKDQPE